MKLSWIPTVLQTTFVALVLSATLTIWAESHAVPVGEWEGVYNEGVAHYQNGEFSKALVSFTQIVKNVPESAEGQYYYAITLAQLGRFKDARNAYQKVIEMAPGSDSAKLAEEGISYLPQPGKLDAPPQMKPPGTNNAPVSASQVVQQETAKMFPNNTQPQANQGMDPQTMQMMMLMGSMGGGKGGGFNPMMIPMIQQMGQQPGANGAPPDQSNQLPPSVFSTMMMNQLMQEFTPFSDKDD